MFAAFRAKPGRTSPTRSAGMGANVPDQVVVIAFAHTKRKPGYWRERIQ